MHASLPDYPYYFPPTLILYLFFPHEDTLYDTFIDKNYFLKEK